MTLNSAYVKLGDLVLDLQRQRVWRNGHRIVLPGLSFRLLEVVVRQAGQVVGRTELKRQVWGGVVVSDDALRQRVRLLRQALGREDYIATIKGIGYRLAKPVVQVSWPSRRRRSWLVAAAVLLALASIVLFGSSALPEVKHSILHALRHQGV